MIELGEQFGGSCQLTGEDLESAVKLTRGRHPVHVDEDAARKAGLRGRILHGAVSAAIMASAIGARFANNDIALLEQSNRYRLPVYVGDTLQSQWTVSATKAGREQGQWLVSLVGELRNQEGEVVVASSARLLVRTAIHEHQGFAAQ